MVKKTQTQTKKAGDEPGYCMKNGLLKVPEKPKAVPVTAKVPEKEKIKLAHDLNGNKLFKQKKPVQKFITPTPSVSLPKSDKKSYWSTPEGKARAKQMSEDMKKHGKLITRTKGK
jgi:hypothetical protein